MPMLKEINKMQANVTVVKNVLEDMEEVARNVI